MGPPPPPPLVAAESKGKSKGKGYGLAVAKDGPREEGKGSHRPRLREGSFYSVRSDLREERMLVLEQAKLSLQETLHSINQALQSGVRPTELRGPPPKVSSENVERPHDRQPTDGKPPSAQLGVVNKYQSVPPVVPAEAQPDPPAGPKATTPSPAYQVPEDAVWNQSALSKALQMMKDTELGKLKFTPGGSKPLEYEKWMNPMATTMNGHHPEIGAYWQRVVDSAEKAYSSYNKDVSYTRIGIFPTEKLPRTPIEERIESRLLMMMNYVVPQVVVRQCDDKPDVTCALLLYRTMVYAGPASKEDCAQMMDILTKFA